jgi:hypothetical protein
MIDSSDPGELAFDHQRAALETRAVLTRAVCNELLRDRKGYGGRRARIALGFLLRWVAENTPSGDGTETLPLDGIQSMSVPAACDATWREICAGAKACHNLWMLWTADSMGDQASDERQIDEGLEQWERFIASEELG